jgi:hypothetical protein
MQHVEDEFTSGIALACWIVALVAALVICARWAVAL